MRRIMSTSQVPPGSNEEQKMKGAMGDEVLVEDLDNKSTYNSLSSGESSGWEDDPMASEEVKKLAKRMAKKMAKKKAIKMAEKMAEAMCEKVMAKMMKKMEKQETSSSSPKKTASSKKVEYNRNPFDYSRMQKKKFSQLHLGAPRQSSSLRWVELCRLDQQDEVAFDRFASKSLGSCECRCTHAQER